MSVTARAEESTRGVRTGGGVYREARQALRSLCPQALLNWREARFYGRYGEVELHLLEFLCSRDRDAIDVGANDISQRVIYNINNCPDTRLVLGGYSLGAAATDMVLALPIPIMGFKTLLPPGAGSHIAAVALFGNGTQWLGPITNFSPEYADRTIELCHGADPICNPADPDTWETNWPDHLAAAYQKAGMINQAADFVASKL